MLTTTQNQQAAGAVAFSPASLSPWAFYYDAPATMLNNLDQPPVAGDTVPTWLDQGGTSGNASAGSAATYQANGMQGGAGVHLDLGSPLVLGNTFTVYACGIRATGQNWCPIAALSASGTGGYVGVYLDNIAYVIDGSGHIKSLAVTLTGTFLTRYIVNAGAVNFAATGIADTAMSGAAQTGVTLACLLARHTADYSNSACRHKSIIVYPRLMTAGEDANIQAWMNSRYGVSL